MNVRRFLAAAAAAVFGTALVAAPASAVPVTLDLTGMRAIQTYALAEKADDQAYIVVTGIAKGKELDAAKFPKDAPWVTGPKKPAVSDKKPVNLWTGDLADGEFAAITVTLIQGKGDAAAVKAYLDKKAAAEKGVAARGAAKLAKPDELKALAEALLKAHREVVVKDAKATLGGRDKNTDHFGGQFTVIAANVGGNVVKRIDPVGLTFGEHFGDKNEKVYSKIKRTRRNAFVQDDAGDWTEVMLEPTTDDGDGIRVKMLEIEFLPPPEGKKEKFKNVTDYLAEVKLGVGGKPQIWRLQGETLGISDVHAYWDWAE
ncbi:MAG TPA: hypothetical protein VF796_01650 [Humisphaera sp.]